MRHFAVFVGLLAVCVGVVRADEAADKAKAEELRKEIEQLRKAIAEKESQLLKLDPSTEMAWKEGSVGRIRVESNRKYYVFRILAPGEAIIGVTDGRSDIEVPIHVKGISTVGKKPLDPIDLLGRFKVTREYILRGGYNAWEGHSTWSIEAVK